LDFLGFIALSTVLVRLVSFTAKPVAISIAIATSSLLMRFVLGAWIRHHSLRIPGLLQFLLGAEAIKDISYPFSPWITYPLLGFIAGHSLRMRGNLPRIGLGGAAVAALLIAAVMRHEHSVFFRWGTMSLAYYVLSLGALGVCLGLARLIARSALVRRWLALRGPASLAVVPLHYAVVIVLLPYASRISQDSLLALLVMGLTTGISIACARVYCGLQRRYLEHDAAALIVAACIFVAINMELNGGSGTRLTGMVIGQLAVVSALAFRGQRRVEASASTA
jgi:hypothetical protein